MGCGTSKDAVTTLRDAALVPEEPAALGNWRDVPRKPRFRTIAKTITSLSAGAAPDIPFPEMPNPHKAGMPANGAAVARRKHLLVYSNVPDAGTEALLAELNPLPPYYAAGRVAETNAFHVYLEFPAALALAVVDYSILGIAPLRAAGNLNTLMAVRKLDDFIEASVGTATSRISKQKSAMNPLHGTEGQPNGTWRDSPRKPKFRTVAKAITSLSAGASPDIASPQEEEEAEEEAEEERDSRPKTAILRLRNAFANAKRVLKAAASIDNIDRGVCSVCNFPVLHTQHRERQKDGSYRHTECITHDLVEEYL